MKKNMIILDEESSMDDLIEKIPVNAGNIQDVISEYFSWNPPLEEQIDRLVAEWMDPKSDGSGFLTHNKLSTIMVRDITKEIDQQILCDIEKIASIKRMGDLLGYNVT
jgi:hypothetical protein